MIAASDCTSRKSLPSGIALKRGAMILLLAAVAGCATTSNKPPESWDGLELRPSKRMDAVYVQPGVQFKAYKSVMIDPLQVSFSKDWDPNRDVRSPSRRLDNDDIAKIRTGLADLFRDVFRKELADGGYALVDAPGPDTLLVMPAIIDLYINAPDRMEAGRVSTYTTDAGHMTLVAELKDSQTGDVIARAVDKRGGQNTGQLTWTNSVTNRADASRAITVWAKALRSALDEMNTGAKP